VPTAGKLGQVRAIAAADIGDGLVAARGSQPEHP
jgi:hypothetical protein